MEPGRASRTAEIVAARRAMHQLIDRPIVFEDPLAVRMVAPGVIERLQQQRGAVAKRWSEYLRAALAVRSRFAEDELRDAAGRGVRQYVLLGAGFDTFAYRNPFPHLQVFEVDHPSTQAVKRRRLAAAGIHVPSNVTYVPVDFATTRLPDGLAASGFDRTSPAMFAWLGVVPYLERDAIVETLRFVAGCAPGTEIVFDYGPPPSSLGWISRFVIWRVRRRLRSIGEPWITFFKPDELVSLLESLGFSRVENFSRAELNPRYLAGRTDGLRISDAMFIARAVV